MVKLEQIRSIERSFASWALLFDISPIPKAGLMKKMITPQYDALLVHRIEADFATGVQVFKLYLQLLSNQYQQHGTTEFSSELLRKVVALQ